MDTLVTALFVVHDDVESVLNTAIANLKVDLRRRREEVGAPQGAHAANTGSHVHRLLHVQATFFLGLRPKQGSLHALLQWQPHMNEFPGMAWCEEKLQATISTLAVDGGGNMTSANAPRLRDVYMTQRLTAGEEYDADRNPIPQTYLDEVKTRLNEVVARVSNLSMPLVEWGLTKEKYVFAVATWPANQFTFPLDLRAPQGPHRCLDRLHSSHQQRVHC